MVTTANIRYYRLLLLTNLFCLWCVVALHIRTNFFMATTANIRSLYVHLAWLPEAICCFQSCCVGMLLILMGYMCIPSFNVINILAA